MPAKSQIMTLKEYFGFQLGQTLQQFSEECKALSPEAKNELALLAKQELIRTGKFTAEDFAF